MSELTLHDIPIQDDYSETFDARMVRVLITSDSVRLAREAAWETKGIGRSATQPPCESTLERELSPDETPDGRPGFTVQMMDRKVESLGKCLALRLRKGCVPYPRVSIFDALPADLADPAEDAVIDLEGSVVQRFGDGFEEEGEFFDRPMYRIPKMDGWLHLQRHFTTRVAVTGGMFLVLGRSPEAALEAAEASVEAVAELPLLIVKNAASGSKVGAANYTEMVATTNHLYCPTVRDRVPGTHLPEDVNCVYEIIVSGPRDEDVREGMRVGIKTACEVGAKSGGVAAIHTANYGGKLGSGKIPLHGLFS